MKSTRSQTDLNIAEQAARWLIDIEEGGPEVLADFSAWLKVSPVHVEEFLMATAVWKAFDGVDGARRVDVERLLAEARDAAPKNITQMYAAPAARLSGAQCAPLDPAGARGVPVYAGLRDLFLPLRSQLRRILAGGAIAVSLLIACTALWLASSARTYATTTGEQRAFKLEDGSIVHLNTQSRVAVDFTPTARTVRLIEGEALFTVERDVKRPFRVEAGTAVFQAIGTQFNVYRRANTTTISVVEGVVQILPNIASAQLAAGEQADVARDGQIAKHKVTDLEQATAWRQRRLVFRGDSLEDVSREFNRYNSLRIEIDNPEIGAKRLTGVFNADDPESLVLFLNGDPDLSIETSEHVVHIRGAKQISESARPAASDGP